MVQLVATAATRFTPPVSALDVGTARQKPPNMVAAKRCWSLECPALAGLPLSRAR